MAGVMHLWRFQLKALDDINDKHTYCQMKSQFTTSQVVLNLHLLKLLKWLVLL